MTIRIKVRHFVSFLVISFYHFCQVFSSMGAGAKCNPTRIQISDISHTIYDPLARSVRRRLRLQGVSGGIPVVYSTEAPSDVKLLPLPETEFQKGNVKELDVFDDFRVRILPVLGMFLAHVSAFKMYNTFRQVPSLLYLVSTLPSTSCASWLISGSPTHCP
jgi:tRNA A37 threonylcarbamoyladenosine dehydratase